MTTARRTLVDGHGRTIDYLRLSVIEQCQMRCFYCRPQRATRGDHVPRLAAAHLVQLAGRFAALGVRRFRLTGGEPLLRKDLVDIAAGVRDCAGVEEVTLSTNAEHLAPRAQALRAAGVSRVNISLDSLDPTAFAAITGGGDLARVLAGIDAALAVGLQPVKLNMVVHRGRNEDQIGPLLDFARARGLDLRFIESMPLGAAAAESAGLRVDAEAILAAVREHCGSELVPLLDRRGAGPARYYRVADSTMHVGIIAALSRHFCADCNRVRLSASGDLQLCLGQHRRVPLGQMVRHGATDADLEQAIMEGVRHKPLRHGFAEPGSAAGLDMMAIGG